MSYFSDPARLIDCHYCNAQNWPEDEYCHVCKKQIVSDKVLRRNKEMEEYFKRENK